MRILHINLADEARGAAQAALRLHQAQNRLGHSSRMLVGHKRKDLPEIEMLPRRSTPWQKWLYRGINRFEHLTGLQYLCQPWRRQFLRHRFTKEADVVNLHNTHSGYFSHTILPALSQRTAVVWTLHDLWSMTGHCGSPYMYGCERWKSGCGKCPALFDHPAIAIDTTAWLWRVKARLYQRSALAFVTPSEWLARMVRQSPLLDRFEVRCIPHGLDIDLFKPTPKTIARETLGIKSDAKVVMFAAFDPFLHRKGGVYLFEALRRLTEEGRRDLLLVTVGSAGADLKEYRIATQNLGLIRDERVLATCFSAADLYVGPSLHETFGLVFMEAMACGTPVVAFDNTAVPEIVRHLVTGYLARNQDADDLTHGVRRLLADDAERERLGRQSRELVEREYPLELQARRYLDLYREVIDTRAAAGSRKEPLPLAR